MEVLSREKGTIHKDPGGKVRVCLVYPNTYSLGITNLGFQAVYHLLNAMDDCVCERAFLPSNEDIEEFKRTGAELFSLESQSPVKDFDIVAFSVPFEDDYVNIPEILELSSIPALASQRSSPLVMAGGVAVSLNPEPVSSMVDIFLIGEAEGSIAGLIGLFGGLKGLLKKDRLRELDSLECVYVPSLYEFVYDGIKIREIKAANGAKTTVRAAKNFDLDAFDTPQSFVVTPDAGFRDTFCFEVERGCGRGCRFCAAGFLYLPPRWRDFNGVRAAIKKGIDISGKVGLVGTAVSDYPLIKEAISYGVENEGSITLSSLRLDRLDGSFVGLLKKGGYSTVTLAPEAGTERMRNIVNKGITDSEIMEAARLIAESGFLKIKLYFIVGLPGETDEDAAGIVDLCRRVKGVMKKGELTASVNPFIPKPFTPFQWARFEDAGVIDRRLKIIKKGLGGERGCVIKALSAREAFIQAYMARADRRAGELIVGASKEGWKQASRRVSGFLEDSVYSERTPEDALPWDMIDHGIKKAYLRREYEKGLAARLTPACDVGRCFRCGVCMKGPSESPLA